MLSISTSQHLTKSRFYGREDRLRGRPTSGPYYSRIMELFRATLGLAPRPPRTGSARAAPTSVRASLAVRHCAAAISPYVLSIAQRISISQFFRHILKWNLITLFDGLCLLNGQRRALQHTRSPCNGTGPRVGSLRDGAVDNVTPGGHETEVYPILSDTWCCEAYRWRACSKRFQITWPVGQGALKV